jgi:nucleotide-binding universal stress UspA family protein
MPRKSGDAPIKNVFTVLDPTRMVQPALDKAEWIAERNGAGLHLYCCLHDADLTTPAAQKAALQRTKEWLDRLAATARARGLKTAGVVEWSPDWREALVAAAAASECDLIVKTSTAHLRVRRRLVRTADWMLLGRCPVPLLLVNPTQPVNTKLVLAAVKLKPVDEVHIALNERVVETAHRIARAVGAQLHAVTVHKGNELVFDRKVIAASCRLPWTRVHTALGAVHRGIVEVAEEIGAGIIIVGSSAGVSGTRNRADAARLIVDEARAADIVVLPASQVS